MLSFEVKDKGHTIQVHCDADGLKNFITRLQSLLSEEGGHIHLYSPSMGGKDLNATNPWGQEAVDEVIIDLGGD